MMKRLPFLLIAAVLAGCSDDTATPDPAKGRAATVQAGSISDAMIPLDQLESQAPLLPDTPSAEASDDAEPARPAPLGERAPQREDAGEAPAAPAPDPTPEE